MRKEKKSLAPKIIDERAFHYFALTVLILLARSEERRVGKECRL